MCVIHWFRRDLRLQDNSALHAALKSGQPVVPLFIFDEMLLHSPRVGQPRLVFMLNALKSLDASLRHYGSRLLIRHGMPQEIFPVLVQDIGAQALYFNADYSPYARARDAAIEKALSLPVHVFDDAVLDVGEFVAKLFLEDGRKAWVNEAVSVDGSDGRRFHCVSVADYRDPASPSGTFPGTTARRGRFSVWPMEAAWLQSSRPG